MIIGIPRERKPGETRVATTPEYVAELVGLGHQVIIETNAGAGTGFTDEMFTQAGGTVAPTVDDVWNRADLLVKVKEPAPDEFRLLRKGLTVFSFLHPAADPVMTKALIESGATGLDYDLVTTEGGKLPILEPMSQIAGRLAIQCGARALQRDAGGRGVLLGGALGVPPGKVLVVGAGTAGSSAAWLAIGMGAEVTVMDVNKDRLAQFAGHEFHARTVYSTAQSLAEELAQADIVIGAVLVPGAVAPKLLTRRHLLLMKPGAVIVDIAIDQGGFAESSKTTSISEPTYVDSGIVHYCVPNMPALVPLTSTRALTSSTFPWIKILAQKGVRNSLREHLPIRQSLVALAGRHTNSVVARELNAVAMTDAEIAAHLAS